MSAVELRRWTRDEYERMIRAGIFAPEERVELIDGEIIHVLPPRPHEATSMCLTYEALRSAFGSTFLVRPQLSLALGADSQPNPDAAVVRGGARDYRDRYPETAVLVVEIADSSLTFDQGPKACVYARANIADYWIVNLADQRLEIYREPAGEWYKKARYYEPAESVAPLAAPDSLIAVADLLP